MSADSKPPLGIQTAEYDDDCSACVSARPDNSVGRTKPCPLHSDPDREAGS